MNTDAELYHVLARIRGFEDFVLENFHRGLFFGTTHTCLGQEANAVGVLNSLLPGDIIFSNHRGHGHFLAYSARLAVCESDDALIPAALNGLFAELMGRGTGICGGRGGSQHLQWRDFYSNGVQGGIVPLATGMALAEKYKHSDRITIAFLGDGTLGEGVVYETLNMASLWQAPVLYVLEDNHIAQTTPSELALAGKIAARFTAFDIPVRELDTSDVKEIIPVAQELCMQVRSNLSPRALILHTCRFGPHSKGDDTRPLEQIEQLRSARDPLAIQGSRLLPEEIASIEAKVKNELANAFERAVQAPYPSL